MLRFIANFAEFKEILEVAENAPHQFVFLHSGTNSKGDVTICWMTDVFLH